MRNDSENVGLLFYPCSGCDWVNIFNLYSGKVATFLFTDLLYQFREEEIRAFTSMLSPIWLPVGDDIKLIGPPYSHLQWVQDQSGRHHHNIKPAWLQVDFINTDTRRKVSVTWRRGFGQYALDESANSSVLIFCHRGDSGGDGGSGVHFFSDRDQKHSTLSRLFSKLKFKLKPQAVIISDGSNTGFKHLRKASKGKLTIGCALQNRGLEWHLQSEVKWDKAEYYGRCFEWAVKLAGI